MNMKKKPQRYSHKKLLSTMRRPEGKIVEQSLQKHDHSNYTSHNHNGKSSSRNKSAEKILSVYESSRGKFKIGKFLSGNERQYRVKTQTDEMQRTRTNYNKINSVRKLNQKDKQDRVMSRVVGGNVSGKMNGKVLVSDTHSRENMPKQRTFTKRLNLNSQLFENMNSGGSLQKLVPQTSKNQKRTTNLSFRKEHDSYRAMTKKTALEKYISESLENLDCPGVKKKNSRGKGNEEFGKLKGSKEKQVGVRYEGKDITAKKHLLVYKGSKETQYQPLTDSCEQLMHNTGEVKESRTVREGRGRREQYHDHHQQQKQHQHQQQQQTVRQQSRRIKTQADDSLQKIEIKWQKKRKNPYDVSNEQVQVFGDRFPDGFQKMSLLGRGGFSLVWLGQHKKSRKQYAVKQIITQSSHQTHKKQIWFGTYFFQFGGAAKQQFSHHVGIRNLVKLYYYFVNKKDTWLLYERCGDSLGNVLYELKGENFNGQKMYRIYYKEFYTVVRRNPQQVKKIIFEVAKALQLLAENNIVHSDLKTENILVKFKSAEDEGKTVDAKQSGRNLFVASVVQEVKLIDYGSSFQFSNLRQFSMATPQYMAPEILNFILYQNELEYIPKLFDYVQDYTDSWVIDIWSLGCVILEIISGIPLWMSLKTIVKKKGKEMVRYGLFAVKGRTFDKIIKKQVEVVQNLERYIVEENYSEVVVDEEVRFLLKRMLALNPAKRISPKEIIEFLGKKQGERG